MKEKYKIKFDFIKETKEHFIVKKNNKQFNIPWCMVLRIDIIDKDKVKVLYIMNEKVKLYENRIVGHGKIYMELPTWYCKKELGFYN